MFIDEFLSADRSTLIGIREGRRNEGSATNPPKGRFVTGVFYVAAKAATYEEKCGGFTTRLPP
jgi:hypothetical protein